MSYPTTFKVSAKAVEKVQDHYDEKQDGKGIQIISRSKQYKVHHCTEVLQGSNFPPKTRLEENGFVKTVIDCYNGHHNLVLRPDDVWTAILVQFSFYINKVAEKFRGKFVSFEGKKELVVRAGGTLRSVSYGRLVEAMTQEIDKNLVDPEVKGWILPSFSTTTQDDLVTCGVIFMATMKKYFDYKFCLCCGIPYVTLEGTVEDWEEIEHRLEKLKEYELDWWYEMLKPILHQFVKAKKGEPETDFWDKVCHHFGGGSGPSYISGWITAFCVFDKDGNQNGHMEVNNWGNIVKADPWVIIDDKDIPTGSVEVDVKIDDNGTPCSTVMFAGHMANVIEGEDGTTLRPHSGWVICLKPDKEEEKRLDEKKHETRYRYSR